MSQPTTTTAPSRRRPTPTSPSSAPATSAQPTPSAWPCSATTWLALDVDPAKIEQLSSGHLPIYEPGLEEKLQEVLASGKLRFTTDVALAGRARGRPLHLCRNAAVQGLRRRGPELRRRGRHQPWPATCTRKCLIVGKSTVPMGTAARLTGLVHEAAPAGRPRGTGLEPRIPARGLRHQGHARTRPAGLRDAVGRGRANSCRLLHLHHRRGNPRRRHGPGHGRTREGRRELLPGHQDLLHQRDGGNLRDHGSRRQRPCQGTVLRHPDRRTVPQARARLRRRLPAQGHPRVRPPGRDARRRTGRFLPPPG